MSKRKAPEPTAARATGKQKMPELAQMDSQDLLSMALGDEDQEQGDLLPSAEDLEVNEDSLALAAFGDDGIGLDEPTGVAVFSNRPPPEPEEVGELPDGLEESDLRQPEVDLSQHELTIPQARRVAQILASNLGVLTKISLQSHSLDLADLEEDELEWDSEEYTDITAIFIAELLKSNETVKRLDLARNQIGDAGACALAKLLQVNSTIEYLNLESNEFSERAGYAFCDALETNESLTYLNLKENAITGAVHDHMRQLWQNCGRDVGLHL